MRILIRSSSSRDTHFSKWQCPHCRRVVKKGQPYLLVTTYTKVHVQCVQEVLDKYLVHHFVPAYPPTPPKPSTKKQQFDDIRAQMINGEVDLALQEEI